MISVIETHTDGTLWVQCRFAKDGEVGMSARPVSVYHPNAKPFETGNHGSDDHYRCPDCKKEWWVEIDG